ncbi:MAG: hypothetical protein K2Y32_24020 [Candidatus Obscuribacterales bacterium]|nr:hypothetical protein [Candidatus Obscuribacterales bacterium]
MRLERLLERYDEVYGRILRVSGDAEPELMAPEPQRRLVMVMDSFGLSNLQKGRSSLLQIGYTNAYIDTNIERGISFYLLAFAPQALPSFDSNWQPLPATWANVIERACWAYPDLSDLFRQVQSVLPQVSLADLEVELGAPLSLIDAAGPSDERYISLERLKDRRGQVASADLPNLVRRFLYHVLRLSELFSGDSYTREDVAPFPSSHGEGRQSLDSRPNIGLPNIGLPNIGLREYVMPNLKLAWLGGSQKVFERISL